jgi:hypothetical protein
MTTLCGTTGVMRDASALAGKLTGPPETAQ